MFYLLCVCECDDVHLPHVYRGHRDNLKVSSFYCVGSGNQIQVTRSSTSHYLLKTLPLTCIKLSSTSGPALFMALAQTFLSVHDERTLRESSYVQTNAETNSDES